MKKLIRSRLVTSTVILIMATSMTMAVKIRPAEALFGMGDIVFDPSVFMESLLSYLEAAENNAYNVSDEVQQELQLVEIIKQTKNQFEQIANQIESLRNQVESIAKFDEMLEDWAKQLAKIDYEDFYGFVEVMGEDLDALNEDLIKNSRGYVKDYENVREDYDEIFDTFEEKEALTPEAYIEKEKEWNEIMIHTSFDSTKAAEILGNSEKDASEVATAMQQIAAAEGTVGVLQGMAGLDVVKARQAAEMRYLMVTLNQQLGVEAAVEASEREQDRRDTKRFYEEATKYEEISGFTLEEMGAKELYK